MCIALKSVKDTQFVVLCITHFPRKKDKWHDTISVKQTIEENHESCSYKKMLYIFPYLGMSLIWAEDHLNGVIDGVCGDNYIPRKQLMPRKSLEIFFLLYKLYHLGLVFRWIKFKFHSFSNLFLKISFVLKYTCQAACFFITWFKSFVPLSLKTITNIKHIEIEFWRHVIEVGLFWHVLWKIKTDIWLQRKDWLKSSFDSQKDILPL